MPVTPIIVLGVGGTGMKALLQLKKMIALNRPGGMRELPALRLLCIDSDDLIRPTASPDASIPISDITLDPTNEYLKLEIPGNVGYNDLDRAKTWFPRELEYFIPDLSTGCKQYKSLGRLLFAWNYGKFLKLVEPLRGMVDSKLLKKLGVHQVDDPLVFIVSSLCGGTGAGMFLDVAYTLTNLWKRKWNRFNTKVCGLLALPSVFSDISQGTERIRSNAYASMKELDHFMNKDVYMDPELAFRTDYPYVEAVEAYNFAPLDRAFVFDNSNGRVNISSSQVYEMMARYIYLMVCGELTQDYNSIDNNLNPKIRGVNRMLNKPTCYSSFGYYSVVFPKSVAVQLASADLALDVVEQELVTAVAERDLDKATDALLTANKIHFSNQSPQILQSLSFYNDSTGHKVNIQDTIGSTVANIDLSSEPPENHEAILREYDTRFSTTDLALFEADSRREALKLLRDFRTNLEAEIQKLANPAQNGSVRQVHLFVEALHRQVHEDVQAIETLAQQTEKQLPGLKSSLENQFLKLRQTASSKSLFSLMTVKKNMAALIGETREVLENYWLQKRRAVVLRNALLILRGEPSASEADVRTGALSTLVRERESYTKKLAVLKELKERILDIAKTRHSVSDGEFYKVAFDYHRDVTPVIESVKVGRGGRDEARKKIHTEEVLGTDLDGLETLSLDESFRRLFETVGARFAAVMDQSSLDERVTALGDMKTQIKTWLNFSRPFVVLDTVDASKYGFSEQHNAARFIAIPNTYVGKPCEQILNRCPVRSEAECDKYEKCLKRSILESLPEGTSVGHMAGRHEIHFLSLYHGFTASSLLHLISDSAGIYRNHLLGHEKIHMFGPTKLYDLKEALPNKTLERLKDHFYLSFASGWIVWSPSEELFLFRSDADLKLNLAPSVKLGSDIGSILDNYHSPEAELSGTVRAAFDAMARRLAERKDNARELGREVLAFVEKESSALEESGEAKDLQSRPNALGGTIDESLSQYLVIGIGDLGGFGSSVIERVKALPIERNVVYHQLEVEGGKPVAEAYVPYRERLLGVLNREVFNFANTPLTVYLVGLLVEEHMASNLMHLGYLFKSFFRENIILSPRIKVLTAFPTIIPETAYCWLPATQKVLAEIDGYASLKEPFQPRYPDLKRSLPSISGPPFENVVFCYCESLDEDDMEVSAQAAATKIYFDLVLLPERMSASEGVTEFYRNFPAGQGFVPISGTALSFLPSIQQMVRDEMEYLLMIRLCEKFFPAGPAAPGKPGKVAELVEPLLAKAHAAKLTHFVQEVVRHSLENERWFDLAAIDVLAKFDIEMSPPADAYLQRFLSQLDQDKSRFAGRVRDLALETILQVPDRIRDALTATSAGLDLSEIDSLFTQAFFRVQQLLDQRSSTAQQLASDWKRIRSDIESKVKELKSIVSDRGAKLKKGSDTEARIKDVFSEIHVREILEKSIALSAVEGLAGEGSLESRLRESYDRIHNTFADLLKKRTALLAHLHQRRDAYLRRRELYLYVFNQVFRQRFLDKEIERKIEEVRKTASEDSLAKVMESFFFKKWLPDPALSFDEAEKGLMEAIRLEARPAIEKVASEMKVDYREVVRILQDIADAQVNSIFDMKYKEHPQAAYRQAMFLCHKDETLASALGTTRKRDGIDLSDVFVVKNLPFQALQLMELYNLPFRALRQYASLDRHESKDAPPSP